MKSKLNYLISISLGRKIKTKWFLVANIILALVIVCAINIDSIISLFGGDFDKQQEIYVIDNTNITYDIFLEQLNVVEKSLNTSESSYKIKKYEDDIDSIKERLEKDEDFNDTLVIVFNENIDSSVNSFSMLHNTFIVFSIPELLPSIINRDLSKLETISISSSMYCSIGMSYII